MKEEWDHYYHTHLYRNTENSIHLKAICNQSFGPWYLVKLYYMYFIFSRSLRFTVERWHMHRYTNTANSNSLEELLQYISRSTKNGYKSILQNIQDYIPQMLLKIKSFSPYLTQWKATVMPHGKPTPAGKDAVWQVLGLPFMTRFSNIKALLLSLPVHSVDRAYSVLAELHNYTAELITWPKKCFLSGNKF